MKKESLARTGRRAAAVLPDAMVLLLAGALPSYAADNGEQNFIDLEFYKIKFYFMN